MKSRLILSLFVFVSVLSLQARTLRILAIGNSFSRDAVEQNLHEIAAADGDTAVIGNLFIGGCSLERHLNNVRDDRHDYVYRKIGADGRMRETKNASVADALADEAWDYVSMQQASPLSGIYDTYAASLPELLAYVKAKAPKKAGIVLHQTWAYQQGAGHSGFGNYGRDQLTMYRAIVGANDRAAKAAKIKTIVPAGTAIQNARTSYIGDNLNRDGYHLDLGIGRFTAACAWYEKLFCKDVTGNTYLPAGMNPDLARTARAAAHAAVLRPSEITDLSAMEPSMPLYKDSRVPVEIRVADLLARMTLDEKVLQLNQYTLGRNNNANNIGEEVKEIPAEIGSLIYFDTDPG
ncbi:MAG: DUF4886 domain-containing protein, partial [Duncaniella sp.]|nr:DUF4886 domain-containing protein [Duncaniella sp.]